MTPWRNAGSPRPVAPGELGTAWRSIQRVAWDAAQIPAQGGGNPLIRKRAGCGRLRAKTGSQRMGDRGMRAGGHIPSDLGVHLP